MNRSKISPHRETLRAFAKLAMVALASGLPALAGQSQEEGRDLEYSLSADAGTSKPGTQQLYEVLMKMLDRWNAHDLEGHLDVYWKSPELLIIVDAEQFIGWQQLHDSYVNGYVDRSTMGYIEPKRIQFKLLEPDVALALTWWAVSFPGSKYKVTGNTTMNLQKFPDGWKIVASHTSTTQMSDGTTGR